MIPQIIYEDKNFLAVDKPAGLLVHSAPKANSKFQIPKSKEKTLIDWLVKRYPEIKTVGDQPKIRPGIVHRLDKDTSGVILIARNQDYFNYLKQLFQGHKIKKTYLALVWGKLEPKTGTIKKPISLKTGVIKRTVWRGKLKKIALTEYKTLRYFRYNLLEKQRSPEYNKFLTIGQNLLYFSFLIVIPTTGRTHQIRVHLASIGHPIVGDSLYGPKKNPFNLTRQFLHAESLEFNIADGKRIKIEAGLPEDLREIIILRL